MKHEFPPWLFSDDQTFAAFTYGIGTGLAVCIFAMVVHWLVWPLLWPWRPLYRGGGGVGEFEGGGDSPPQGEGGET